MTLVVQKYGGTSVGSPDRIRTVAGNIARFRKRGDDVIVVVSAMGKMTDELDRLAHDTAEECSGREMDLLLSSGERIAMALLAMALNDIGCPALSFTGSQAGIITDNDHQRAKITEMTPYRIRQALETGHVAVVAGFQGVSKPEKDVTTLGRGGSDTTAVALAAALKADSCQLYSDVSGVFSADPRVVPAARRLKRISWDEMVEACAAGCPKPDSRAAEFARTHKVQLEVRSAFTWEPGTIVGEEDPEMEQAVVSAVISEPGDAKITVAEVPDRPGMAAGLFSRLAAKGVNVDLIVQSVPVEGKTEISFTIPSKYLKESLPICQAYCSEIGAREVLSDPDVGKVSIVGAGMKANPGVAAGMFQTLANNDINIQLISTSPIRTSVLVKDDDVDRAVQTLHTYFGLDDPDATR